MHYPNLQLFVFHFNYAQIIEIFIKAIKIAITVRDFMTNETD